MSEAEVTKEIIDYLEARGWVCRRQQSGLFRSTSGYRGRVRVGETGMPDYECIHYRLQQWVDDPSRPGEVYEETRIAQFWIEFKAPGARTDPKRAKLQAEWAERERERGGVVVQFDDPEKFKAWYQEAVWFNLGLSAPPETADFRFNLDMPAGPGWEG